jgi:membrane associated rhomboid family serine protease/Zn-finger nucleic acid-binding protein
VLCPDDQRPLVVAKDGAHSCPLCRGRLVDAASLKGEVHDILAVETRTKSPAFARQRLCPACTALMAPWRIGQLEAWLERCPQCQVLWVETLDQRTLEKQAFNRVASQVYQSLSVDEKKTLAKGLASEPVEAAPPPLSAFHSVLAMLGLPVVTRQEGGRTPLATWSLAALALALFIVVDPMAVSLVAGEAHLWQALTSIFAHFGWLHLLGNVYFLLAFGDGVEQKLPRWAVTAVFFVSGILAALAQGLVSSRGTHIGGASGAVAAIVAACVILQPRARVAVSIRRYVIQIPIAFFGLFELAYQAFMASAGVPGIAWTAHLTGLTLGAAIAVIVRGRRAW